MKITGEQDALFHANVLDAFMADQQRLSRSNFDAVEEGIMQSAQKSH
jgi:hypothetical protein